MLLIKLDVRTIFVSFNNDDTISGAGNKAAIEVAEKLHLHFDPEQVRVALPSKNDFGEMNKTEIKNWHTSLSSYA